MESKTFVVRRSDERSLKFKGKILAHAKTSPNRAYSNYSGADGVWSEATVYQTDAGKYVIELESHSQWSGVQSSYQAYAADTLEQAISNLAPSERRMCYDEFSELIEPEEV